ncbi:MAG: hypothetical protein UT67_C0004G0003 [Candidatus Magasanikbacteria bacterium GW2011_GWA2_40_10]|uniref:Uncharacterized protein n=1 Tax=Candidatus Magasanikbacteria bacterium GW2011_GWA2_40_10 TaxID=1619037 RepID=A0A0G0Q3Q5_9BACT|nr:MAG: hypothetical protein UT67_C0004G0003 [Candidatus Magasanikbacteria bacterium GW2011_GWA2_40_10]
MLNIYNPNNHDGDTTKVQSPKSKVQDGKVDFGKYVDPTKEFTSQDLKWSFWYVKHKALLYRIMVIGLISVNAVFILFGLWKWGSYLWGWQDAQKVQESLSASIDYTGLHPHFTAQPIQAINTQIFSSRENKFDAVAELINPNSRFLARFDYYFIVDGVKTLVQKTFLLPGESRLVAYLGINDGAGSSPIVVLENIKYERISAHKIPDTINWQAYRLNFQVSDFVFLKSLAQEGQNTDAIQFKLTNASPYSYVTPIFYVALLQNGQMVGILPLRLESINSLETKDIDLRNFVSNLSVTEIALYPIINVYDEGVYIP